MCTPHPTPLIPFVGGGGGRLGAYAYSYISQKLPGAPPTPIFNVCFHVCFVSHLAVGEVSHTLDIIKNTIDRCMTLAHKLNFLLPERDQLEEFLICPQVAGPDEDDSSVELKEGDLP